jgi:LmbE family N-acetylglucosaminyl deacetylase
MTRVYNVVSPHLDDAALSCSLLLAANPGSYVTTVFAAGPESVRPLTRWDRGAKYFPEGADVTGVRRGEDISATALVRATAIHLSYWDRQYRNECYGYQGLTDEELPGAIAATLASCRPQASAAAWVIPLGLGHPDHRLVAEAALILAGREPGDVFLYEELPYAAEDVSEVAARKRYFAEHGLELEDDVTVGIAADRALKAAVLRCHASQRRALRRRIRVATRTPERVWKIVRRQERCRSGAPGGVIAEGEGHAG